MPTLTFAETSSSRTVIRIGISSLLHLTRLLVSGELIALPPPRRSKFAINIGKIARARLRLERSVHRQRHQSRWRRGSGSRLLETEGHRPGYQTSQDLNTPR